MVLPTPVHIAMYCGGADGNALTYTGSIEMLRHVFEHYEVPNQPT